MGEKPKEVEPVRSAEQQAQDLLNAAKEVAGPSLGDRVLADARKQGEKAQSALDRALAGLQGTSVDDAEKYATRGGDATDSALQDVPSPSLSAGHEEAIAASRLPHYLLAQHRETEIPASGGTHFAHIKEEHEWKSPTRVEHTDGELLRSAIEEHGEKAFKDKGGAAAAWLKFTKDYRAQADAGRLTNGKAIEAFQVAWAQKNLNVDDIYEEVRQAKEKFGREYIVSIHDQITVEQTGPSSTPEKSVGDVLNMWRREIAASLGVKPEQMTTDDMMRLFDIRIPNLKNWGKAVGDRVYIGTRKSDNALFLRFEIPNIDNPKQAEYFTMYHLDQKDARTQELVAAIRQREGRAPKA